MINEAALPCLIPYGTPFSSFIDDLEQWQPDSESEVNVFEDNAKKQTVKTPMIVVKGKTLRIRKVRRSRKKKKQSQQVQQSRQSRRSSLPGRWESTRVVQPKRSSIDSTNNSKKGNLNVPRRTRSPKTQCRRNSLPCRWESAPTSTVSSKPKTSIGGDSNSGISRRTSGRTKRNSIDLIPQQIMDALAETDEDEDHYLLPTTTKFTGITLSSSQDLGYNNDSNPDLGYGEAIPDLGYGGAEKEKQYFSRRFSTSGETSSIDTSERSMTSIDISERSSMSSMSSVDAGTSERRAMNRRRSRRLRDSVDMTYFSLDKSHDGDNSTISMENTSTESKLQDKQIRTPTRQLSSDGCLEEKQIRVSTRKTVAFQDKQIRTPTRQPSTDGLEEIQIRASTIKNNHAEVKLQDKQILTLARKTSAQINLQDKKIRTPSRKPSNEIGRLLLTHVVSEPENDSVSNNSVQNYCNENEDPKNLYCNIHNGPIILQNDRNKISDPGLEYAVHLGYVDACNIKGDSLPQNSSIVVNNFADTDDLDSAVTERAEISSVTRNICRSQTPGNTEGLTSGDVTYKAYLGYEDEDTNDRNNSLSNMATADFGNDGKNEKVSLSVRRECIRRSISWSARTSPCSDMWLEDSSARDTSATEHLEDVAIDDFGISPAESTPIVKRKVGKNSSWSLPRRNLKNEHGTENRKVGRNSSWSLPRRNLKNEHSIESRKVDRNSSWSLPRRNLKNEHGIKSNTPCAKRKVGRNSSWSLPRCNKKNECGVESHPPFDKRKVGRNSSWSLPRRRVNRKISRKVSFKLAVPKIFKKITKQVRERTRDPASIPVSAAIPEMT